MAWAAYSPPMAYSCWRRHEVFRPKKWPRSDAALEGSSRVPLAAAVLRPEPFLLAAGAALPDLPGSDCLEGKLRPGRSRNICDRAKGRAAGMEGQRAVRCRAHP